MAELIKDSAIEEAYNKQKTLVAAKLKTKGCAGYKAAVSAKEGQKSMGLKTLVSGVLYADGLIENESTIQLSDYTLAKIETEIGYKLSKAVNEPTTAETVKDYVCCLMPAYEVPDITVEDPSAIKPTDIIANNGFSSHYVVGKSIPVEEIDPNSIEAKLYHNNVLISSGKAIEAMDNQWEALSVALNIAIEHGYHPQKGDLVITGALGKILPIEKGTYTGDYGALGALKLNVE